MNAASTQVIDSEAALRLIYGAPAEIVQRATLDFLHDHHISYIRVSPLVCIASIGGAGCDCSPRGGEPGFVRVLDRKTIAIPDFPGNNRIETLVNIVQDNRVGLVFLFPGLHIFLRVNGRAEVVNDEALRRSLAHRGRLPITAIRVNMETVFFQCGRASTRSRLWDPGNQLRPDSLPSVGTILKDLAEIANMTPAELDAMYKCKLHDGLY